MLPWPSKKTRWSKAAPMVATALSKSMVDGSTFCTTTPPGFRRSETSS